VSMFLVDYEDTVADATCGMSLWLKEFEATKGIRAKDRVIPEALTQQTISDLRMISNMPDEDLLPGRLRAMINDILSPLTPADKQDFQLMELLYRRLGHMVAFALFLEPDIRESYDQVEIDDEMCMSRDPLFVICHPTRLLKSKMTHTFLLEEAMMMPANLTNKKWLNSWLYDMRMHVNITAAEEFLMNKVIDGITSPKVDLAQVRGIFEGYISQADGALMHPYVYGMFNPDTDEWTNSLKDKAEGKWIKRPVWEYPGGIVSWVQLCGEQVAVNQFPTSPFIKLDLPILNQWVAAQTNRQRKISEVAGTAMSNLHLRNVYFSKNTSECRPAYGNECQFLRACWAKHLAGNPLKDPNLYVLNLTRPSSVVSVID
jgi:hypothetical protein